MPSGNRTSDRTFHDICRYGSPLWAATVMGDSYTKFRAKIAAYEKAGFPKPDPITGRYLKGDVLAWIDNRRTHFAKPIPAVSVPIVTTPPVKYDEL